MVRSVQRLKYKDFGSTKLHDDDKQLIERRLEVAVPKLKSSIHWDWLKNKITGTFRTPSQPHQVSVIDVIYCLALGSPTNNIDSCHQLALIQCIVDELGCKDVRIVEPNLSTQDEDWFRAEHIEVHKPKIVLESFEALNDNNIESIALDSVKYLQEELTRDSNRNIFVFAPHCPMLIALGLGLLLMKTEKLAIYINDLSLYFDSITLGQHDSSIRSVLRTITDTLVTYQPSLQNRDDDFFNAFHSLALYHKNGADNVEDD